MRVLLINILLFLLFAPEIPAQSIGTYLGDEEILNAQTKQVNQFFRRFNCEESTDGKRYYPGDSLYRHPDLREKYLNILFDESNYLLKNDLKNSFIEQVLNNDPPIWLDFHGGNWFAEVSARFRYMGEEMPVILFMKLQEEKIGSKWVLTNVYFAPFAELFFNHTPADQKFLHPLSHELDFMNLIHVFKDPDFVEQYTSNEYQPDFLTLFIYEIKKNNLEFITVQNVKFHFFQIDGWYMELAEFNRPGYNSGWLISKLLEISASDKEILMNWIYHE